MATVITNVTELQAMENDLAGDYELGNDIDASATAGWNGGLGFDPVGSFTGSLDGKGFSISDLTINRPAEDYVGLFSSTNGAALRNIKLVNANIHGEDYVGALVGYAYGGGTISDSSATGSVVGNKDVGGLLGMISTSPTMAVLDCNSTCSVISDAAAGTNYNNIGGFVGYMGGAITTDRSYATGNVIGTGACVGAFAGYCASGVINKSYATGSVSAGNHNAKSYAGGFAGWNNGETTDCYARGSVIATGNYVGGFSGVSGTETNCYSTGAVIGIGADIGGYSGSEDTVVDCFWDMDTSGLETSYGGTGKTTTEMKDIATFNRAGWSFNVIWGMTAPCNSGYPCLMDVTPFCTIALAESRETNIRDIVTLQAGRNIEMMALGRFYIDEQGNAKYESRFHRSL